jgi:hypothetical protein
VALLRTASSRSGTAWPDPVCRSSLDSSGSTLCSKGAINHALTIALPEVSPTYASPANRSDGSAGIIPEGQRFRIDPAVDLDALPLTPVGRIVARAVQRFGMFVNDVSGSVSLNAECSAPFIGKTGVNPYSTLFAGKAAYRILDGFPWQRLITVA